jgi:hypothetical protein
MQMNEELLKARRLLERSWTLRLANEYDNVCYCYRIKLSRPVILISCQMTEKLGLWDPETRCISIAWHLIEKYPWNVVVDVLKHEMAHQIVTDLFKLEDGHGECFGRACAMLGVTGWAARATGDLPEGFVDWKDRGVVGSGDSEEDRLLRRVEKLLALASSENEHEAALAMQRVQEIYARHNIGRLENKQKPEMVSLNISSNLKRIPRHLSTICGLLNDFFFVRVIHTTIYHAKDLSEYRAVEILGTRENVLMAEYVYYFLVNQLSNLWKGYRKESKCSGRAKQSYFSGLLSGFREKLETSQKEIKRTSSKYALVLVHDPDLEDFVSLRFPRLVNVKSGSYRYDAETYHAGKEEGRRLIIHKGVESREGFRGRLLPGSKLTR